MVTPTQKSIKKIVNILSEVSCLDETEISILLLLLSDSKITNTELARILKFKDGNSVAYHTRTMQQEGTISRYTIVPNWRHLGLGTEFIVLAEAENEEQLLEIEKQHIQMTDEYLSKYGEIVVIPTISGCVIIQEVYHCFGDKTMAVIVGRAASDQDAAFYCKNYLKSMHPKVKASLLINKYKTVNDFVIDKKAISKLKEIFLLEKDADTAKISDKLKVWYEQDKD